VKLHCKSTEAICDNQFYESSIPALLVLLTQTRASPDNVLSKDSDSKLDSKVNH